MSETLDANGTYDTDASSGAANGSVDPPNTGGDPKPTGGDPGAAQEEQKPDLPNKDPADSAPKEADPKEPEVKSWEEKFKENFPKKYVKDGKPDIEQLIEAHKSLEKKIGHKVVPTDPAEYDYEWSNPDRAEAIDQEAYDTFKAESAKMGMNKEQFQFMLKIFEGVEDKHQWTAERATTLLKDPEHWGNEFGQNVKRAQAAFAAYAPSDIADMEDPVFNHPAIMKMMARIGAEMQEDTSPPVRQSSTTKEQIDQEIAKLRNDPDYYSEANQKKMMDLYDKKEKAK